MRPSAISADVLFEAFRNSSLRWQWVAGLGASERRFDEMAVRSARSDAHMVGYLNYITPTVCRCWASVKSRTLPTPPRRIACAALRES